MKTNMINYILIIIAVCVLLFLYQRMQVKQSMNGKENYKTVQELLLEQRDDLAKSKKPLLWIHIPYEYNSRNWKSFGSRSSFDLNQPYLHLTVQSIINKCSGSFQICIIDDDSFEKLIPDWKINMKTISSPITNKMRTLGLSKLIYIYGGMIVPLSFLCIRDLKPLYDKGLSEDNMFVVENVDRNITSTSYDFYPDIRFMGSKKQNSMLGKFIEFIQRTISSDFTDQSTFMGEFSRWIENKTKKGEINVVNACDVGVKTNDDKPILIEDLLSSTPIDICDNIYGVWIPSNDVLSRRKYEWFARMSINQILDANLIISKYIIMANIIDDNGGIITELKPKPTWVSFWSVPSKAPVWGLKPNYLGNNLVQLQEPSYAGN